MSNTSAAVKRRYNAKAYDRIEVSLPKGYKELLRQAAGGSVTAWIKDAIDAKLAAEARAQTLGLAGYGGKDK